MKKSIILFALGLAVFAACDPEKDEKDFDVVNVTDLLSGATFKQYAQQTDTAGVVSYTEAADGNYIAYNIPGVSAIKIFTKDEEGTETDLQNTATGTFLHSGGGMFSLVPRRGSDNNQTVYFRYITNDGKEIEGSTNFSVYVPSDIAYELKLIASNDYGQKTWTWDTGAIASGDWAGAVWGNMGYCGGAGADVATGNGTWWGVKTSEEFDGQLNHTHNGVNNGDGDLNAYMIFTEGGKLTSYNKDGGVVREGTFSIEGYNNSDPNAWKVGDLKTDAILWPYEINSNGNIPGTYEIVYLTADKLCLVYPDKGAYDGLGSWGEATFWHFKSTSDLIGMAAGYGEGKDWTWDTEAITSGDKAGAVWGNMGYCGGAGSAVGTGNGAWWGVKTSEEFDGQLNHTNTGTNIGDGNLDAYMTFGTDGKLKAYDASGKEIRSGNYEFKAVSGNEWKVADLKTDAILWPFEINSNGNIPGTYEVVYMTSDKMTLVYPDGGAYEGLGAWGEATFWHFKAK